MSRDISTGGNVGWVTAAVDDSMDYDLAAHSLFAKIRVGSYESGQDATLLNRFDYHQRPLFRIANVSPRKLSYFALNNAGSGVEAVGASTIAVDTWYRVGAGWTGAASRVFLEGVQDGTVSLTTLWTGGAARGWRFGSRAGAENNPFIGLAADLAIWNVYLNDNEWLALGKGAHPKSIRPGNLMLHLPMWPSSDTVEKDRSGRRNHFTVDDPNVSPGSRGAPGAWWVA